MVPNSVSKESTCNGLSGSGLFLRRLSSSGQSLEEELCVFISPKSLGRNRFGGDLASQSQGHPISRGAHQNLKSTPHGKTSEESEEALDG